MPFLLEMGEEIHFSCVYVVETVLLSLLLLMIFIIFIIIIIIIIVKDRSTKKKIIVSLEFLGKISPQVKRQLMEMFRTCNNDIKLNVVFKSSVWMTNAFMFE